MSEHTAPREEAPRRRPSTTRESWLPNERAAEDAYQTCMATAKHTVESFGVFDRSARDLSHAVYKLVNAIMPEDVLATLRRPWGEVTDEDKIAIPRQVGKFLRDHNLPAPPLRSLNPFLGWYQAFWVRESGLPKAEAEAIMADAVDVKKLRADRAAENTMVSRYAKLVLVAVDMNNPDLLNKSFREIDAQYKTFQAHNPTLTGKPSVARGRKAKGAAPADTTAERATSDADDFEAGLGDYDPFKDPELLRDVADTAAAKPPADKPEGDEPKADEPKADEPKADEPKADGETEIASGITFPAGKSGEAAWTPGPGISLSTPVTPASIGLSTAEERAASPTLEIEGKRVVIRHRNVLENAIQFRNKQVSDAVPTEGLLRYRKDGDQIIILETMDWTE